MNNLGFFKSLNYDDGLQVVKAILERFTMQYGTTLGLNGNPQIRPLEYKFERDGVLYFDCATCYDSYREMLQHPYLQLCIGDPSTMSYLRIGGKVNFTKDEEVISECFHKSPALTSQFGNNRSCIIGYYLTETWAEFASFDPDLPNIKYTLNNKFDS